MIFKNLYVGDFMWICMPLVVDMPND